VSRARAWASLNAEHVDAMALLWDRDFIMADRRRLLLYSGLSPKLMVASWSQLPRPIRERVAAIFSGLVEWVRCFQVDQVLAEARARREGKGPG